MDYGHSLEFGTFITPQNRRPQDVSTLAQLTERAGLDLVTFQDHPYQSAFLDTWTLLSWVVAQTERVRVSGNVLNLPLRPPAVLARAAASLDLLSGGRFELGLGAGAFWDAIGAMGGPRHAPREAADALIEAIEVIRLMWSQERSVRYPGRHYRLSGVRPGPAPRPSSNRPPDNTSRLAAVLASTAGGRSGRLVTSGKTRTRSVLARIVASNAHVSRNRR
jgi:alkanesulfonate monooxygenase SsuD/methylene tetrahydromethanopterin reductase-like flavin-dependent oxidoreductase (luciferase family)